MKCKYLFSFYFILLLSACTKKPDHHNNAALATNYLRQASVEAEAQDYSKALYYAEEAIALAPTPQALALKATLLYQLKQFGESVRLFQKILRDKQISEQVKADVMNNYACTLLCLNKKDEARKVWFELTKMPQYLSPEVAWFNLGLLSFGDGLAKKHSSLYEENLMASGYFRQAEQQFSRAIDIACNYIDAFFYLGFTLYHLQKYQEAQEVIAHLLVICPDHKPATELLAEIDRVRSNPSGSVDMGKVRINTLQ